MTDVAYGVLFCPICRCPLQRMSDNHGPTGTLEDALQAHRRIVHPTETTQ